MTDTIRSDDDADRQTLKDVSHTPPNGTADANRVFERGGELPTTATDGGPVSGPPSVGRGASDDPEDDEDGVPVEA